MATATPKPHWRLWATAQCGTDEICIYIDPKLKGCDGVTDYEVHEVPHVRLHPRLFKRGEEAYLDEVLLHELVHVCEVLFSHLLRRPSPANCSQYAIVIGKYLSQMQRTLKQVNNEPQAA